MAPRKGKHQHTSSMSGETTAGPETDAYVKNLNLSVLTKHDPEVADFLWVAPYAVVYVFAAETQAWEKSGIEGSFFICTLQENHESADRYKVILLNRRGLDSFRFELQHEDQVEFTDELIIFHDSDQNGESQVYGIWIFSEPEPSSTANQPMHVTELLKQCLRLAQQGRLTRAKHAHQTGNGDATVKQASEAPFNPQDALTEALAQSGLQDDSWAVRRQTPSHATSEQSQPHQGFQPGPSSSSGSYQSHQAQMAHGGYFQGSQQHIQPMYLMQQGQPQYHQQSYMQQPQQMPMQQMPNMHYAMRAQHQQHPTSNPLGSQQQHLLGLFQNAKGAQQFRF